ncbi:SSU ribosomal protein S30P /sigma 54 modulation protein [Ferrimonas sediminum]|uniref:SSU ribosomal protein S30P /sigma 54 modulation protein n=1 Tax=Ferrimonas sediminum TaxID=718193 RepID=A0A1G8Q370_9GAMM|nr:ribosome-associated translation inhibitor RaiA [Ferrimonas sediminum]SDI99163.1 SSU ribosomal protein S30P /sigma 54 modulation protein [Ferrimonas sediminum]
MRIEITSKQLTVTDPIRERIESRFEKLERHEVNLITPHVIITQEGPEFQIEASMGIPSGKLFAKASHENLYNAINQMGQRLERQLNRHTHKDQSKRHIKPAAIDIDVDAEEAESAA